MGVESTVVAARLAAFVDEHAAPSRVVPASAKALR
jgi:hypothetical protein